MVLSGTGGAGPRAPTSDAFGDTPYRQVRRLGSGGMSDVFLVEHRDLEKQFVAKVLREELATDPQTLDRVRIEAQVLGRLNHEHVVSVTDVGVLRDGRPFIVMEYLRGRSLAQELAARKSIPVEEALTYGLELLSALSVVHATGIVHRDIKPSNLFLCDLPNGRRVLKVLDFGVARILPGAPSSAPPPLSVPTATGAIVGTPRYISPEGAMGERVDERADLYCAALVLYTLLAGRGAFDHMGDAELLLPRSVDDVLAPSRFMAELAPPDLDAVILKALERNPADRFQSAEEFRNALERVKALGAEPPSTAPQSADPNAATERATPLGRRPTEIFPEQDGVATRTAPLGSAPARASTPGSAPAIRKTIVMVCAFLVISAVTFAIGVGLVTLVRAYLENG